MVIALVVFSIIAVFTFSAGPMMGLRPPMQTERFMNEKPWIVPPERKSVMVDSEGVAHRTADNTQMTKRDRERYTRPVARTRPAPITPPAPVITEAAPVEIKPAPVEAVVHQPLEGQTVPEPSTSQKIKEELLADPTLSDSARFTLRASYQEGRLILEGVVADEKEKELLATRAQKISGASSVENRLHTLNDYTSQS